MRRRLAIALLALSSPLWIPVAANATSMKLTKTTVDKSALLLGPSTWSVPEGAGTVTWNAPDWTGTYTFTMPSTIPAGGTTMTMSLTAESRKNGYDQNTNFAPAMGVRGSVVGPPARVDISAHSDSGTKPSDTASATVTLTPVAGTVVVNVGIQDGPWYSFTYEGVEDAAPAPEPTPTTTTPKPTCPTSRAVAHTAQACPAVASSATLSGIGRKVEISRAQGGWEPATNGTVVKAGDRIHTGFKATTTLTFPNGTTMVMEPMSVVLIESISNDGTGKVNVRMWLKLGAVSAKVNRSMGAAGDFNVQTPTTTASVRGTIFGVRYDGVATTVSVTEGKVEVAPARGKAIFVGAGQETRSTATAASAPVKVGRAGVVKGSVGPDAALALLEKKLGTGLARCGSDVAPATGSVRLKAVQRGWRISLTLIGKRKGTAVWQIRGRSVRAVNPLAKRIGRGCR